jgi:hypothetical protein
MKIKSLQIYFILSASISLFSQGTNNDYKYDEQDFGILFTELGFSTFKFPIKQNTVQIYDFVIEEFKNGELLNSKSVIEDTKEQFKQYGLDPINYFQAKKDSVYFHRFYFHKTDTSIKIIIKTHGVTSLANIKIPGKPLFDLRALYEIKTEIDSLGFIEINKPKDVLFLWCPAGMPRETVIKKFYYVLFISVKNYNKTVE